MKFEVGYTCYAYMLPDGTYYEGPIAPPPDNGPELVITEVDRINKTITVRAIEK